MLVSAIQMKLTAMRRNEELMDKNRNTKKGRNLTTVF